jgi:hypothetical protein
MMKVSLALVANKRATPPMTAARLRSPIEMLDETVLCTAAVSAERRLIRSPVFDASKKATSCCIKLLKRSARSRVTTRSPAMEKSEKRMAIATPCTAKMIANATAAWFSVSRDNARVAAFADDERSPCVA